MSFFVSYPSVGTTTINGLEGAVTLTAGSNISITPSGNSLIIAASGGGSGATAALDNLAAVAINLGLTPGVTDSIDLGSSDFTWRTAYLGSIVSPDVTGVTNGANITLQPGTVDSGTPGQLNLVGSTSGGNVVVQTAGAGELTLASGQTGKIFFQDGSQGQINSFWTSIDGSGGGSWTALPAIPQIKSEVTITDVLVLPAAGTGATGTIISASDLAGRFTFTTTSADNDAGPQVSINFSQTYTYPPAVVVTAANTTASDTGGAYAGWYVTCDTGSFTINFNAPAGDKTFEFNYICIGNI